MPFGYKRLRQIFTYLEIKEFSASTAVAAIFLPKQGGAFAAPKIYWTVLSV